MDGRRLIRFLAAFGLVGALLPLGLVGAAVASTSVVVNPSSLHGWAPYVTSTDGSTTFVTGPAAPPAGVGSVRLFTGTQGDQAAMIRNSNYAGTPLSSLTSLSYWAYSHTNNGSQFPLLGLNIATSGSGASDDVLFFEPPYQSAGNGGTDCATQQATLMDTWQQWNALSGCWWDNNGVLNPGTGTGTLADFLATYPNATIENATGPLGGVRFMVGEASPSDVFDGNVDAFTIGVSGSDTTYDFEPAAPGLAITKSHVGNFHQGEVGATYKIVVSNRGSAPTTGTVTVTDNLPSGLTATGISGTGWTCSQPVGPCTRSNALAAGSHYAPLTLTVNVASDAPTMVTNSATVTGGGEPNGATATDPTTITSVAPDLAIAKSHRGDFRQFGLGVYTIVVSNVGNGPTNGTVTVHDQMPFGLVGYAISGSGWTCTTVILTCTRSDALAGGTSYPPITVNVAVAFSCGPRVVNVATVAGGGEANTNNDTARDPTNVNPFPIPF